ncbi:PD-(D/E)XK motif protein [Lentimicrobium sp. L6]|uniref:PD-(D/E)XK motif protein n=1 Tax=Lentimicrobium sp. L6 TaxID=2735916 RepID=UPI001553FF8C|nr:PD-(D/E)XK motif protein [Lentimicrobium sp. L6]NPD85366.1 PD-(D/E)XK motif protein [Lentimicrobium sp. L6]
MSRIKEIWNSQAASFKNEVIRHRVEDIKYLKCCIGTVSVSKAKIFTLEIDPQVKVHPNYLKRFIGVEVQVLQINEHQKELVLILLEEELADVFVMFIEDIIQSLADVKNSEDALLIISNRINYWRKLFGKFTNGLLSSQQQRGLYGELYFLKLLLELDGINKDKIINAWQAPDGANQDFYFNGIAVEVKTSIANTPSIKIANEFQLDIDELKILFISFYKLNEYPNGENTLFNIITEIRNILNLFVNLKREFNLKLEILGISLETESEYDKIGYSISRELYYKVTDNFPRITSEIINQAISKVSYEISPIACVDFEVDINEITKEII